MISIIKDNFSKLVGCTVINTTLLSRLLEKGVINIELKEELDSERFIMTVKSNKMYDYLMSKVTSELFEEFIACLDYVGGNDKALSILKSSTSYQSPTVGRQPVIEIGKNTNPDENKHDGQCGSKTKKTLNQVSNDPEIKIEKDESSEDEEECYPNEPKLRKHALIINILENRMPGANEDGELENILKGSGYDLVKYLADPKKEEIEEEIRKFKQFPRNIGAVVVAIMGHGNEDYFFAKGHVRVNIQKDIIDQFNSENCPTLYEITTHEGTQTELIQGVVPKIFLINTCRGKALDNADQPDLKSNEGTKTAVDLYPEFPSKPSLRSTLICHSTAEGCVSGRSANGSKFIQAFCEQVKTFACKGSKGKEILDVLNRTSRVIENDKLTLDVLDAKSQEPRVQSGHQTPTRLSIGFSKKFYIHYKP